MELYNFNTHFHGTKLIQPLAMNSNIINIEAFIAYWFYKGFYMFESTKILCQIDWAVSWLNFLID